MKMNELFFMAEVEGELPTRQGRINAAIRDIRRYPAPAIDHETFCDILEQNGLKYEDLTEREYLYIVDNIRAT